MVEFSNGYKDNARRKQEALEKGMTQKGVAVARGLFGHFDKSSTKTSTERKAGQEEAA
ncbi:MAG TPA: hypothetical protein VFE10_05500 [Phenylobacterium sp.]|jgi:hypothetical protein|nr:hypothetical protein [Phenylobacterium sp.]